MKKPAAERAFVSSAYGAEFVRSVFEKYAIAIAVAPAITLFASLVFQLDLFIGITSMVRCSYTRGHGHLIRPQ